MEKQQENYKKVDQEFLSYIQKQTYKIATRDSALALSQVYEVIDMIVAIKELGLTKNNFQVCPVKSEAVVGDQNLKDPLYKIGGQGVFTKQIEDQILIPVGQEGSCDIAIHSLKDLPTIVHSDLIVAAVPDLQNRDDVVIFKKLQQQSGNNTPVYQKLEDLPQDSVIGTSSLRRITNLKHRYPQLKFKDIRGNLQTRFQKLDSPDSEYAAIILARAGIDRLKLSDRIGQILEEKEFLYAPSQGALGVQCKKSDVNLFRLLQFIQNDEARLRVDLERQFLNKLEGGCKLPIASYSEVYQEKKQVFMVGQVWSMDGAKTIRKEIVGDINDDQLGKKLSDLMKQSGASEILYEIQQSLNEQQKK